MLRSDMGVPLLNHRKVKGQVLQLLSDCEDACMHLRIVLKFWIQLHAWM